MTEQHQRQRQPDSKWWGQSMTIWGAIITDSLTVLPALGPALGIDITADLVREAGAGGGADGAGRRRTRRHNSDDLRPRARLTAARATRDELEDLAALVGRAHSCRVQPAATRHRWNAASRDSHAANHCRVSSPRHRHPCIHSHARGRLLRGLAVGGADRDEGRPHHHRSAVAQSARTKISGRHRKNDAVRGKRRLRLSSADPRARRQASSTVRSMPVCPFRHSLYTTLCALMPVYLETPRQEERNALHGWFHSPGAEEKAASLREMAQKAGKIWKEHGALEFRECIADDVKVGKLTSFPPAVKLKRGETVSLLLHRLQDPRPTATGSTPR